MVPSFMDTSFSSPPDSLTSTCTIDESTSALLEFSALASNIERSPNTEIHGPYGNEPLRKVWSRNDFCDGEHVQQRQVEDKIEIFSPKNLFSMTRGRDLATASVPLEKTETRKTAPFYSIAYPVYHVRAYQKQHGLSFDAVYETLGGVLYRGNQHRAEWILANENPVMSVMYLYGQRYRNNRPVLNHQGGSPPEKAPSKVFAVQQEPGALLNSNHMDTDTKKTQQLRRMQRKVIGLKPAQPLIFSSGSSGYSTSFSAQTPHLVQTIEEEVENPRAPIDSNDVATMFRDFYGESANGKTGSTVTILDATSNEAQNENAPHIRFPSTTGKPAVHVLKSPMMRRDKILLPLRYPHVHPMTILHHNKPWADGDNFVDQRGQMPKRWDAPYSATTSPNMVTPHFEVDEEFVDFNKLCFSGNGSVIVPPRIAAQMDPAKRLLLDGVRLGEAPLSSTQIGQTRMSVPPVGRSIEVEHRFVHDAQKQLNSLFIHRHPSTLTSPCSPTSETLTRLGTKIVNETCCTEGVSAYIYNEPSTTDFPDSLRTIQAIHVKSSENVAKIGVNYDGGGLFSDPEKSTELMTMPDLNEEVQTDSLTGNAYPAEIDFTALRNLNRNLQTVVTLNPHESCPMKELASSTVLSSTTAAFAKSQFAASTWDSLASSAFGSGYMLTGPITGRLTQSAQSVVTRPKCHPPIVSQSYTLTTEMAAHQAYPLFNRSPSHALTSVSDVFHTITLDDSYKRDENDDCAYKSLSASGRTNFEEKASPQRKFIPHLVTYVVFKLFPMWIKLLSCRSHRVRNRDEPEPVTSTSSDDIEGLSSAYTGFTTTTETT